MATNEQHTLSVDDRPTVGQVVAICKQIIREERWHRRVARRLEQLRRMDWAAWRFRRRMAFARIRNESSASLTRILQREVDRVAAAVDGINKDIPREQHVRGKVYLPRGVFIVNRLTLNVPDRVDIVWPKVSR